MTNKHILIIDDEDDIREVAQISLETMAQWEVSLASSGKEGIAKAKSNLPDAILLDVMMPEMDGIETFKKLRQDPDLPPELPVILLTAKVQANDKRKFKEMGVGHIAKPFDPITLADKIVEILNW